MLTGVPLSDEPTSEPLGSVTSPKSDHDDTGKSHAHTIDEAIAEFQTAVKTPEPESSLEPEGLSAVEIDDTSAPMDTPARDEQSSEPTGQSTVFTAGDDTTAFEQASPVNGDELASAQSPSEETTSAAAQEDARSSDDVSATAPRTVSRRPVPPTKDDRAESDQEGGNHTMEDIDID